MDLQVSAQQFAAVRAAKHLPDVLHAAFERATRNTDGYLLHLTYEEATALNELCAWNVVTNADGTLTPQSKLFDDLVRAILTHPDY